MTIEKVKEIIKDFISHKIGAVLLLDKVSEYINDEYVSDYVYCEICSYEIYHDINYLRALLKVAYALNNSCCVGSFHVILEKIYNLSDEEIYDFSNEIEFIFSMIGGDAQSMLI